MLGAWGSLEQGSGLLTPKCTCKTPGPWSTKVTLISSEELLPVGPGVLCPWSHLLVRAVPPRPVPEAIPPSSSSSASAAAQCWDRRTYTRAERELREHRISRGELKSHIRTHRQNIISTEISTYITAFLSFFISATLKYDLLFLNNNRTKNLILDIHDNVLAGT